jgi:hypothetical protein
MGSIVLARGDEREGDGSSMLPPIDTQINPTETSLLVTEPYFNLPNIAETYDQMIFEEWEFNSYFRATRKSWTLPFTDLR